MYVKNAKHLPLIILASRDRFGPLYGYGWFHKWITMIVVSAAFGLSCSRLLRQEQRWDAHVIHSLE